MYIYKRSLRGVHRFQAESNLATSKTNKHETHLSIQNILRIL